ncbi:sugar ABC transporter substrate-binding protein [Mesorhizobium sp. LHD-90]|uniref:ABC transporter substrate-binding protein n=1 Tax=Mesorhizobium sp. LHD-90 TaxID=3071414 RepID=UPI0027DFC499|nr:sugar ABC transporter substrate-binding protein [Mesorhizobium sp. LHD-90]MDQ6435324.1 sugar ABC transporter substrate-binding protein [Mesorhizobium sp. LHD-90]
MKTFAGRLIMGGIASVLLQVAQAGAWTLEEAAKPYSGATVRVVGEALPPLEALAKLAPQFEQATGIDVEVEMYEHSEAVNKVQLDLNSRRGRYDVIIQPHRELGKFATNGHLLDLAGFMNDAALRDPTFKPEEQLYEKPWKEISWYDGKMYGFPFTVLNLFMWYRTDLLSDPKEMEGFKAKYGYDLAPAQNWDQYRDIAEWFYRPDQGLYGTALQAKRHEALWYEWLNFLYSFGGDVLDVKSGSECGPVIVNSPQAVAALDYYKSLLAYSPPDSLNYFWDDVMALMQQGKVAELIMWNDATYAVAVDETASTVVGKVGFDITPQGEGGKVGQIEGWSYLVPTYSKNQQAAFLFMQWMMGYDRQLEQHLNGGATGRPDVYAAAEVQKLPYSNASMAAHEAGRPKATLPQSSEMTDILVRELSSSLTGEKSSKAALDTAATEISKLLGSCAPMSYPAL